MPPPPLILRSRVRPQAKVFATKCDVGAAADVDALAAFAQEKLGVLHYWVNNAGINGGRKPFVDLTTSQIEAVVKVNMLGSLLCTSAALKLMKEQRGVKVIGHSHRAARRRARRQAHWAAARSVLP